MCPSGLSSMGPLPFSILLPPPLVHSSPVYRHHQYADGTQLHTSLSADYGHSTLELSTCVDAVTRWHLENDLVLNPSQSEALITGSRHQVI